MHGRSKGLPIIIITILALLEVYAYSGFKDIIIHYSPFYNLVVKFSFYGLLILSLGSIGVIFLLGNRLSKSLRNFLFAFVFINLSTLLIFNIFVLLDDVARLFYWVLQANNTGHSFYFISIALSIAILPAILFLLGMIIGPYRYKLHEISIPLQKLPKAFEGLKIVQISDIHSGSFYNKKAVAKGVKMILDQQPDVIFFTGDLVNDDATEMDPYKSIFKTLNAPLGVYSILGNHDYGDYVQWPTKEAKLENLNALKNVHQELGWRLLLDEHVYLEKEGEKIALIGVENWGKGFHQIGDLERANKGCEANIKLLLSHDPTHWDEQVTKDFLDIDVTFSGHTHGAQMGFEIGKYKWSPISLRYKKWAGLYQLKDQFLYINRGFGFLGYPGRLGIWPEISVIRLVKEK